MLLILVIFLFNPLTAKLFNLNFHSLEVVCRWRDPQLQVSENYSDLTKWRSTVFKYCWLMSHFIKVVLNVLIKNENPSICDTGGKPFHHWRPFLCAECHSIQHTKTDFSGERVKGLNSCLFLEGDTLEIQYLTHCTILSHSRLISCQPELSIQ